jgi:hypothetical protein
MGFLYVGGSDETRTRDLPALMAGRYNQSFNTAHLFLNPILRMIIKKAHPLQDGPSLMLAGATRLELATSGVTGRRYNRLNYAPLRTELPLHEFLGIVQQENHFIEKILAIEFPAILSCLPRARGDRQRADGRIFWGYRAPTLSWHPAQAA